MTPFPSLSRTRASVVRTARSSALETEINAVLPMEPFIFLNQGGTEPPGECHQTPTMYTDFYFKTEWLCYCLMVTIIS